MNYLRAYDTIADYNSALLNAELPDNAVIYIRDTDSVIYFRAKPESDVPLYIEALEDLTASFSAATSYSLDGIEWISLAKSTATPTIPAGSKVYFKASGLSVSTGSGIGKFTITGRCYVGGNALSMIYGTDFASETTLSKNYALTRLFYSCKTVLDARRLSLPSLILSGYCYSEMFYGCSSLVNAPELPATTLADYCYYGMFYGCTSLTHAPERLPATTMGAYSCYWMFYGCSSLVNAPELPATTMADSCYYGMFYNCSSLVNAPELPATTLASYCYREMFYNCKKLAYIKAMFTTTPGTSYTYYWLHNTATAGTFVKNAAATWNVSGYSGIPNGWTVETASA